MCLQSYAGGIDSSIVNCHLISPIKTSDAILAKFPKTKIMIASNDPIRDESYRLTLRLLQ